MPCADHAMWDEVQGHDSRSTPSHRPLWVGGLETRERQG
jgi:hypothetical protein